MHTIPALILALSIAYVQAALSGYAPVPATCPSTPLVRTATGISASESSYISARAPVASAALGAWLHKVNSAFSTANLPAVALTTSGGGLRSLLTGAGVIQALDSRDSSVGTSGLFQGLTYQAGLSGGGWLLSSFAGNNYPTISNLESTLWTTAFAESLLVPDNLDVGGAYAQISVDVLAKNAAGYPPTIVDIYGRLLAYQLLKGPDGGVAIELSSITGFSNFTSHNVPFPIITSLNVETATGVCTPPNNTVIYEFSPYEFGSFDSGVNAFTQTKYLGTSLSNGAPTKATCETNYDNLGIFPSPCAIRAANVSGYILGTSSDIFNELCLTLPLVDDIPGILANITAIIAQAHAVTFMDEYATYPNPFYKYAHSTLVQAQTELTLVDGGESHQNNPLFPLLEPARSVGVILVNDNSADTSGNFPDGSELYQTYMQAQLAGLTKMPVIPPASTFLSQGYNQRPTFFGCNDASTITIVYLPNYNYTFPSGESTEKVEYLPSETSGMIANGGEVATMGGSATFPTCLACAIVKKTGDALPAACTSCFSTFCYN
ncbi:hypothetical protein IMSHALPRED_009520 [Imshaugia aleurites]|uniref:Lysophospholipase n=1 Tax=Imshaugia aleurites TaxID=172621 RepID=A0A8H3G181_9LECA|nr:hypothetical protein IMSHALPRED_009520 [Imshaugia aleurites]